MKVPLLDLKLQYKQIQDEVEKRMLDVTRSQMLILGKEVEKLENSLADYCGVQYAIGCSSGTDALWIIGVAVMVCLHIPEAISWALVYRWKYRKA